MTLAVISADGVHTIQEKTDIPETEAFPTADRVAIRLFPGRSPIDKHFPSLLRRHELVDTVKRPPSTSMIEPARQFTTP